MEVDKDGFFKEERTMEKEKIEVRTYKFKNGETIDEILSKQTSWATDEECLDNMIDNSLREVADFADEKENELLKKISIAKNNPEVDLKLLAVQTDAAARYMAEKHYDDILADAGKRPFSKYLINIFAQDDFPYEFPSWMKNHLEEYPDQNLPEHTSEEERTMEKEKIEVQTYKFKNGETIDEILSKQTSWATDEECLDNMIDNSLREVADFANEKENELLKKISIEKNNPEVDLKLLAVQTDVATRYMAEKHYDDRLADVGKRPFSKIVVNMYNQDVFPYELPSWMKNYLEEYPDQNLPEHTSEEEKAYQEWEEMLDDNQKAEEIIERNQRKEPEEKTNYVLNKLSKAGIEVVTDKEEFNRTLESQRILQKMQENNSVTELFISKNEENLNSEIDKLTINDIGLKDEYIEISKQTPFIFKEFGLNEYPVCMYKQKLARALFLEKEKFGERRTHGHKDEFTSKEVKEVFQNLGNPRYVFNSRRNIDVPDDFYLIGVYDQFDKNKNPMMVSFHFDKNKNEIEANWVTAVYGRNKIDIMKNWIDQGFLLYVNDTEIEKASEEVGTLYMRVMHSLNAHSDNIVRKSDFVNNMNILFYQKDNTTYGFAHNGKIYLNPDVMNSEAAVHEYTHLWDAYTQKTNPELWEKGLNIFKGTHYWEEVKSDPNYADISNDDNLVLSEIHSRICGKMAEKILSSWEFKACN